MLGNLQFVVRRGEHKKSGLTNAVNQRKLKLTLLKTSTFLANIGKTILFQVNVNNIPKITIVYVSLG